MECPLCGLESKFKFEVKRYVIRDCIHCDHRFAQTGADESHVAATYDDAYFHGGGPGYPDYRAESDMLRQRGRMYAKKVASFAVPGSVLDVGAAAGFILRGFADEGWNGAGIEPNAAMARFGRETLGLEMHCGSLESFNTERRFEMVSMIQVAAHFYDPKRAFEVARELLAPNGLLLIETWDRASMSARLFGQHWHEYSPPSVLHGFSRLGLQVFLKGLGFVRVAHGRPSKKISGSHVRSLLRYRVGDNFLLRAIPTRMNFPYPSEDLFWALFKKR